MRRRMLTGEGEIGRRREKGERRQEKKGEVCRRREKEKREGGKKGDNSKERGDTEGRREKRDKKRRMKTEQ